MFEQKKNTKEEIDLQFVKVIVANTLPHSLVRSSEFKKFISLVNPQYKLPETRQIKKIEKAEKNKLQTELIHLIKSSCQCATLSADGWSAHSKSFFALLIHFVHPDTMDLVRIFFVLFIVNILTREDYY
jgi:hypothetical protein